MAKDVQSMKLPTINGKELNIQVQGSDVLINNAKVIKTDVTASNGVIHLIDAVILPPQD
jgi:uncharacterized surface protein with fasciclin (FAS1) repeats